MSRVRDPEWLAEVRAPGPNGETFEVEHHLMARAVTASNIVQDDTDVSQFIPGAAGYAGYSYGHWANMTAVRAYARANGAQAFAYTPSVAHLEGADAIDIEPTLAVPSDAPAAYHGGIRRFYMSAGTTGSVKSHLAGAGINLATCHFISAHYIGPHICGPGSCGYPQANSTQFTDHYMGRSLDATMIGPGFFPGVPVPPVNPFPTLQNGATGTAVTTLQTRLNVWHASPPVTVDGWFGAATETAVRAFQAKYHLGADGIVGPATWALLRGSPTAPPVLPPPWVYGPPMNLRVVSAGHTTVKLAWLAPQHPIAPSYYECWIYKGTTANRLTLVESYPRKAPSSPWQFGGLVRHQRYTVHLSASGPGGSHLPADVFASVTFTTS
jgi:hypothetical protein